MKDLIQSIEGKKEDGTAATAKELGEGGNSSRTVVRSPRVKSHMSYRFTLSVSMLSISHFYYHGGPRQSPHSSRHTLFILPNVMAVSAILHVNRCFICNDVNTICRFFMLFFSSSYQKMIIPCISADDSLDGLMALDPGMTSPTPSASAASSIHSSSPGTVFYMLFLLEVESLAQPAFSYVHIQSF